MKQSRTPDQVQLLMTNVCFKEIRSFLVQTIGIYKHLKFQLFTAAMGPVDGPHGRNKAQNFILIQRNFHLSFSRIFWSSVKVHFTSAALLFVDRKLKDTTDTSTRLYHEHDSNVFFASRLTKL